MQQGKQLSESTRLAIRNDLQNRVGSYIEIARRNNVSRSSVKRIAEEFGIDGTHPASTPNAAVPAVPAPVTALATLRGNFDEWRAREALGMMGHATDQRRTISQRLLPTLGTRGKGVDLRAANESYLNTVQMAVQMAGRLLGEDAPGEPTGEATNEQAERIFEWLRNAAETQEQAETQAIEVEELEVDE